jgi:hypothetical protein
LDLPFEEFGWYLSKMALIERNQRHYYFVQIALNLQKSVYFKSAYKYAEALMQLPVFSALPK